MTDPNNPLGLGERLVSSEFGSPAQYRAVRRAVEEMNTAVVVPDLDMIRRLSLPNALHLDRNGKVHPLQVWLDRLSRRPELRPGSRLVDFAINITDSVAVVTGLSGSAGDYPILVTQIWLLVLGSWQRGLVRPATAIAPVGGAAEMLPEIED